MNDTEFVKEVYNRLRGDVATLWETEIGRDFLDDIRVILDYCDELESLTPGEKLSEIRQHLYNKEHSKETKNAV